MNELERESGIKQNSIMNKTILLFAVLLHAWGFAPAQNISRDAAGTSVQLKIDTRTPQGLRDLFRHASSPLPLVSAHRGGPQKGFPENCIATFEHTLTFTYAIMEIDPRYTKDGKIVLHHDPTLERTTTGRGKVSDFTLPELKKHQLKDPDGNITEFQIPTLDEALKWAHGRTILVLDQKDVPAAERVRIITEHKAEAYAMLIVNSFKDAQACHALNPDVMLEVMIPNRAKAEEFDRLNVPWNKVVAFVGHTPPNDDALYEFIHRKGASCMIGTSRNLDMNVINRVVVDIKLLEPDYRAHLRRGADIIETDIPTRLGPLLYGSTLVPESKKHYFQAH